MKRRFVLSTDPLTAEEEKAIKAALDVGIWWHWLPNFWLIIDRTDTLTADYIRAKVREINDTKRCFVMEAKSGEWAALTKKNSNGVDMAKWLHSYWTPDD